MKKNIILLLFAVLFSTSYVLAQDSRLLKSANRSYDAGKKDFNKERFDEAAESLEIVVENINVRTDSRKYLLMRFEANVMLIDIYFNQVNNLPGGCKALNSFLGDIDAVKSSGIFKAKDIYKYLEMEKDLEPYKRQCDNFESIDDKKDDFEKIFDEEFEDEE
jgi:hypothetical protein